MKKALSLVSLLLTGLFLLSSCTQTPTLSLSERITQASTAFDSEAGEYSKTDKWSKGTMNAILRETQSVGLSDLTPRSFSMIEEQYYRTYQKPHVVIYSPSYKNASQGRYDQSIESMNETAPMERIVKLSDNWLEVLYRVTEEGLPDALMGLSYGVVSKDGETESWSLAGHPCFFPVTGPLGSADFDGVQVGDLIDDLCEIDPSIGYDILHAGTFLDKTGARATSVTMVIGIGIGCTISKVLTDGVLCLRYNDQTKQITEKIFYPCGGEEHVIQTELLYIDYSGYPSEVLFIPEENRADDVVPYDATFLTPLFS